MQGKKDYQEKLFISFQLSDRIPQENFYRRLKESLDLSFVRRHTCHLYGSEGQKSIDPVVFFKLMLIGYLENTNSDRKILEQASMRMDMLYFLDYDIDEELPWHSTLSRTRKLYGDELFLLVFRKVLSLCVERGMVNGQMQAVDSAYVKANASMDSLVAKQIEEGTVGYLQELSQNEEPAQPKSWSNSKWTSTTDPDARISKKKHQQLQLNYAAQVSVDTASHVICGALADYADKRDSRSMKAVVKQTYVGLETQGITVQEVLADTNYSSGSVLKFLDEQGIGGFIPCHGGYKPERGEFTYDKEKRCYVCPQGKMLPFKNFSFRAGRARRVYWSSKTVCGSCSQKESCAGKRGFKMLEETVYKSLYDSMHQKVTSKRGKRMRKLRSATVEPVLASLLCFFGMRRVNSKGISSANKHVLMAATAYNIKKMMRYSKPKQPIAAVLAEVGATAGLKQTIFLIYQQVEVYFNRIRTSRSIALRKHPTLSVNIEY